MTDMRWTIVAFDHPGNPKSVIYKQGIDSEGLFNAVWEAVRAGANLMSIRGFRR